MNGNVMPMMVPRVGGQQQPLDISKAVLQQCAQCGGSHFDKVFKIGLISPMAARNLTRQEIRVEYQTYLCRACGHEFGAPLAVVM